jgi:hypothetical protein
METKVRGAWIELKRRPSKERLLWLALFGAILLPLLGALLALVGLLTHTSWLEILGAVLVVLRGANGLILRAIPRIHAWRQTRSVR